jgi:hypothetical protein
VTGHADRWITDADGRVLLTHGVNMVYKVDSYAPDEIGFDDDDAAFLAANGFDGIEVHPGGVLVGSGGGGVNADQQQVHLVPPRSASRDLRGRMTG